MTNVLVSKKIFPNRNVKKSKIRKNQGKKSLEAENAELELKNL